MSYVLPRSSQLSLSKIRFFQDSNLESESDQRFESEPESESCLKGTKCPKKYCFTKFNLAQHISTLQMPFKSVKIIIQYNLFTKLVQACKPLYKIHSNICHFWVFWGEFRDSRIQTSGFESRTHESTSKIFESHESNGKLRR